MDGVGAVLVLLEPNAVVIETLTAFVAISAAAGGTTVVGGRRVVPQEPGLLLGAARTAVRCEPKQREGAHGGLGGHKPGGK